MQVKLFVLGTCWKKESKSEWKPREYFFVLADKLQECFFFPGEADFVLSA